MSKPNAHTKAVVIKGRKDRDLFFVVAGRRAFCSITVQTLLYYNSGDHSAGWQRKEVQAGKQKEEEQDFFKWTAALK